MANKKYNSGQAMLMAVILFLFLSISFITGVSSPILRQAAITNDFLTSRKSYFLSEAGVEDAIYKIKNSKQIFATDDLILDGVDVTIGITDTTGTKTIETVANDGGLIRSIEAILKTGVGSSFNYGIQSGAGGFVLGNNAVVDGSVYANGSIIGGGGSAITGSAISGNSSATSTDQSNDSPLPPSSSITFGDGSNSQDLGQSFKTSANEPLAKISLYIKKVSTPSNLTVRITTDNAGQPSTNTVVSTTLDSSRVTASYSWVDVSLPEYVQLTLGTTYWLVLDGGNSSSKYYIIGANSSYPDGQGKVGQYGGTWNNTSPSGLDAYFKIYLGGLNGWIDGLSIGTGSVGNAEAYQVKNSTIAGSLYCQTGSGNNKSCDTSMPVPPSLDFPISDGNIDQWKNEAAAGGTINGDYMLSTSSAMGPKKIIGNLSIDGNKTLTLNGTIWVTGNVTLNNGAVVRLSSSYGENSGMLITDGKFVVSNNSSFSGSGQTGSYIMALTTSDCPISDSCAGGYAMDVSNNAGAVILNAQKGYIHMNNNATVKEITAYKIIFDNNANVIYEQGIANTNFVGGPTGGWTIRSWAETE